MKGLWRGLLGGAGARAGYALAVVICGLVSLKLAAAHLPQAGYGLWVFLQQLAAQLALLDLGWRTAVNRELLAARGADAAAGLAWVFRRGVPRLLAAQAGLTAAALGAVALTPGLSGDPEAGPRLAVFGAAHLCSFWAGTISGRLVGAGRQALFFGVQTFSVVANLAVLWIGLALGCSWWALPAALAASSLLAGLWGRWALGAWLARAAPPAQAPRLDLRRQLAVFAFTVLTGLSLSLDLLLAAAVLPLAWTAAYGAVWRLGREAVSLLQAAAEASWPLVAARREAAGAMLGFIVRANAWVFGYAAAAFAPAAKGFAGAYLGAGWILPEIVLAGLAARIWALGLGSPFVFVLFGQGRFGLLARVAALEVALLATGTWVGLALGAGLAAPAWAAAGAVAVGHLLWAAPAGARAAGVSLWPLAAGALLRSGLAAGLAALANGAAGDGGFGGFLAWHALGGVALALLAGGLAAARARSLDPRRWLALL